MQSGAAPYAAARQTAAPLRQTLVLALFSCALFLSAAAMFMIQPMIGKMLLPRIGGAPAGWIVALAFFQSMLLAGYLIAHLLARLTPRGHGALYLLLLISGMTLLPVALPSEIDAAQMTPSGVFWLLARTAGLPFIALAATAATLQRLFVTSGHDRAGDPYFLYAASNLGSFAGLLLYPLFVEPASTLDTQGTGWFYAYALLCLFAAACIFAGGRRAEAAAPRAAGLPPAKDTGAWIFLSFVPSALLLSVTTHIVTDIVSAPLIWVLPLALYLLTFIAAFARRRVIPDIWLHRLAPAAIALAFVHTLLVHTKLSGSFAGMGLHLACFSIVALLCHQRLADKRPAPQHLTFFYLMIALGGALGGLFNALVAPVLFTGLWEYPLFLLAACFAHPSFRGHLRGLRAHLAVFAVFSVLLVFMLRAADPASGLVTAALFGCIVLFAAAYPRAAIAFGIVTGILTQGVFRQTVPVFSDRNFFGVVRVTERQAQDAGANVYTLREIAHGTTLHGVQVTAPDSLRTTPTAYFHAQSPIAEVINRFAPAEVAVVGLGAGTLACHQAPGRKFTFFEIDPAVIRIADEYFSFLSDCPGAAPHTIIEADGRLGIAAAHTAFYDLIVLDAFSSDTMPAHLMTVEALRVYLSRLNAGGMIAMNISSRYFDIAPVVAATAAEAGMFALHKEDHIDAAAAPYIQPSHWVVMGRDLHALESFARAHEWFAPPRNDRMPAWHDNYSNILGVIRK